MTKGRIRHRIGCSPTFVPTIADKEEIRNKKQQLNSKQDLFFWIIVVVVLTLLFSTSLDGPVLSFYFVCFLLPVVVGTSYFFNNYLVPNFLLKGKRTKFYLYFGYLLVSSLWLELLVMILAFVILADYQIENLGKIVSDIYLMAIILYLIVFSNGFINVIRSLRQNQERVLSLEEERKKDQTEYLVVRVDRTNVQIQTSKILFIESLSDYVKIHTTEDIKITKEKISALEKMLPTNFVRIHRSFVVNREYMVSYSKESVVVKEKTLPIGRKYKKTVSETLEVGITS